MITAVPPGLSFAEVLVTLIRQKPYLIKDGLILLPHDQACQAVQAKARASSNTHDVIPAKAGTQENKWIPAFAGMTIREHSNIQERWPLQAWSSESLRGLLEDQPVLIAVYPDIDPTWLLPLLERQNTDLILLGCDPLSLTEPLPLNHPQYAYQQLLKSLGISSESLNSVPEASTTPFIRTVMQPATRVPDWTLKTSHPVIPLACTDRVHEARTLGRLVCETLASQSSLTLVIPEEVTQALVEATLNADGIFPYYPQGRPATDTPEGHFSQVLADILAQPDFTAWMKLLKHPYCTFDNLSTAHNPDLLAWEATVRQNRPPLASPWMQALLHEKEILAETAQPSSVHPFEHRFKIHMALWETFSSQPLPSWVSDMQQTFSTLPPCDGPNYKILFKALLANIRVIETREPQQAVTILSSLNGWFITDDVVVLADFVEGTWPRSIGEESIGHQAFDVVLALSGKTLYLSWPYQRQGQQTIASRWSLRLQIFWEANKISPPVSPYPGLAHHQDYPEEFAPLGHPQAQPPSFARPRHYSVSGVQRLMHDPYVYYLCDILSLKPWRRLSGELAPGAWGTFVHQLVAEATTQKLLPPHAHSFQELQTLGDQWMHRIPLNPYTYLFWKQRWSQIAQWLLKNLDDPSLKEVYAETSGRLNHEELTITAIADRLELSSTGEVTVVDFKTGQLPTVKEMVEGWAPQLPLEGWMAQKGQFTALPASSLLRLRYVQLKGHGDIGSIVDFPHAQQAIDKASQGLVQLVRYFIEDMAPYSAAETDIFWDYAPLVRRQEWIC